MNAAYEKSPFAVMFFSAAIVLFCSMDSAKSDVFANFKSSTSKDAVVDDEITREDSCFYMSHVKNPPCQGYSLRSIEKKIKAENIPACHCKWKPKYYQVGLKIWHKNKAIDARKDFLCHRLIIGSGKARRCHVTYSYQLREGAILKKTPSMPSAWEMSKASDVKKIGLICNELFALQKTGFLYKYNYKNHKWVKFYVHVENFEKKGRSIFVQTRNSECYNIDACELKDFAGTPKIAKSLFKKDYCLPIVEDIVQDLYRFNKHISGHMCI